jgi:hypothetical protein
VVEVDARDDVDGHDRSDGPVDDEAKRRPPPRISDKTGRGAATDP